MLRLIKIDLFYFGTISRFHSTKCTKWCDISKAYWPFRELEIASYRPQTFFTDGQAKIAILTYAWCDTRANDPARTITWRYLGIAEFRKK